MSAFRFKSCFLHVLRPCLALRALTRAEVGVPN